MDGLADAVEMGLTKTVCVSNYSTEQMRIAHAALAKRGVPLASNQVEYSLLQRTPERELLPMAKHFGMTVTPWAPLAGGAGFGAEGAAVGVGGADVFDGDAELGAEEAEEVDDAELVDGGVEEAAEAEGGAEEMRR